MDATQPDELTAVRTALEVAMHTATTPADRDCWETPPELFSRVNWLFDFGMDVCALKGNCKVPYYLGPDRVERTFRDGLMVEWYDWSHRQPGVCWCNPPYSNPMPWVDKAILEVGNGTAAVVVMLLPVDTSTAWFSKVYSAATELWLLQPRVKFVGAPGSPRWANMLAIFQWRPELPPTMQPNAAAPAVRHWKWLDTPLWAADMEPVEAVDPMLPFMMEANDDHRADNPVSNDQIPV